MLFFPENGDGSVELELKDMALVFSWSSSRLKEVLGDGFADSSTPVSCSPGRIKSIAALVEEQNIPEAKFWLSSGVSCFLYLYTSIHGYQPMLTLFSLPLICFISLSLL